jgi:hypothetical protein
MMADEEEDPLLSGFYYEVDGRLVEVTSINVLQRVEGKKRGYWEEELATAGMCPCPFFHTQHDGLPVAMRVLARSRDGHHLVACGLEASSSSSSAQVWSRDSRWQKWALAFPLPLPADTIQGVIITEAAPLHIEALTLSKPGPHDLWLDGPVEDRVQFELPPRQVLVQAAEALCILSIRRRGEEVRWLQSEAVEAQALGCYIKRHAQERSQELDAAFAQYKGTSKTMDPSDFTLTFHADPLVFPSIISTIKFNGRPAFCSDKGPRVIRSPPLTEEEELEVNSLLGSPPIMAPSNTLFQAGHLHPPRAAEGAAQAQAGGSVELQPPDPDPLRPDPHLREALHG